ncbi:intermembrane transport protein PqiB [Paraburkholderia sp.]|uniref:PqiB family protein n=1 Tax=Paraburkholderia sp. TaxID=1926495 RepID=UPI0039E401AF
MDRPGRPSIIWLIPLAAALAGGALLVQKWAHGGPDIRISLASAEGLQPGKTRVRYRDVDIGGLTALHLSVDRTRVLADVALDRSAKRFAECSTRYWIVRPRIDVTGISALATVLSGAYIATDIGHASAQCRDFAGLETPPIITSDQEGKRFTLRADSLDSLTTGSPVYFRRIQVGRVLGYSLSKDGSEVVVEVFVRSPYDRRVKLNSRWWQASGIDLRLDSSGFRLDTQSMASVLSGGIAFDTAGSASAAPPAENGASFMLAGSQEEATRKAEDGPVARVYMRFAQSLRGLSVGAPVDFRGVELGQVAAIDIDFNPASTHFDMTVALDLYPSRLGKRYRETLGNGDGPEGKVLLHQLVADGLRGQLRTGSLLTGQRYIALDFFPRAPKIRIDTGQAAVELPTVPGTLDELQDQLARIAQRLDQIPSDEIGRNLNETLANAASLFQQVNTELVPEARSALLAARQSFDAANATLQLDSPLQSDVHQALSELRRTLASLNSLTEYLQRHPEAVVWGKPAGQ